MIALNRSPNQVLCQKPLGLSDQVFATESPLRQPRRAGFVPLNEQCVGQPGE